MWKADTHPSDALSLSRDALDLLSQSAQSARPRAGFYAMTSFHLLARDRPSIYKPFEVAAFLGFFAW